MTETIAPTQRHLRPILEDLVTQAELLGPEGEGLDLEDLDLTRNEIAGLRTRAATTRSAIDEVNRALARSFAETLPKPNAAVAIDDRLIARLSWTNPKAYWLDSSGIAFATWLKDQTPEDIAKVVSKWSRRDKIPIPGFAKSSVPKAVWETFTVTRHEDKPTPTLEVTDRANIDTQWIQRLAAGDVGAWRPGNHVDYFEKGKTPTKVCAGCGRFYSIRTAHKHKKCEEAPDEN